MPGIITHHRIFIESVQLLSRQKKTTPYSKLVGAIFNSDSFRKAALFGAIGPNVFDYIPIRKKNIFGSEISFFIHNGGTLNLVRTMLRKIRERKDHRNEWSTSQRAYLYGFISHIIADTIFHPFVFYWSGFPGIYKRSAINLYRKQNLLFEYNMDLYFQRFYNSDSYTFNLDEMLPVVNGMRLMKIDKAVKTFILDSLKDTYPKFLKKVIFKKGMHEDTVFANSFGHLDLVPYLIRFTYWLKRNRNDRVKRFINELSRNRYLFSDLIVRYPVPRELNRHVLNLHRERWYYPAGLAGFHYDSVEDLFRLSKEKIVEIWEMIEALVYNDEGKSDDILALLSHNALTGEANKSYDDMESRNPVRIRI